EGPVCRWAGAAAPREPEQREGGGVELAEQARAGARRARRGEPRQARPPLAEGLAEVVEALARERQSLERGARDRRRLVTREREHAELDRLDAEAALTRPRERSGQLGDEA